VPSNLEEAAMVFGGEKTIHQAAETAKAKRQVKSPTRPLSRRMYKATTLAEEDAMAESHRILALLNALTARDPSANRRRAYKSASMVIRKILR
jgi:hypothetical protein